MLAGAPRASRCCGETAGVSRYHGLRGHQGLRNSGADGKGHPIDKRDNDLRPNVQTENPNRLPKSTVRRRLPHLTGKSRTGRNNQATLADTADASSRCMYHWRSAPSLQITGQPQRSMGERSDVFHQLLLTALRLPINAKSSCKSRTNCGRTRRGDPGRTCISGLTATQPTRF